MLDDFKYEGTETVNVSLYSNGSYNLSTNTTGAVSIYDNDPKPKSTITMQVYNGTAMDWYAEEKNSWEAQNSGVVNISRSGGDNSQAETVYYTVNGTATNGIDYN